MSKIWTSRTLKSYFVALVLVLIVSVTPIASAYTFSRFPWYSWIPAEPTTPTPPPVTNPKPQPTPPPTTTPKPTPTPTPPPTTTPQPTTPPTQTTLKPIKMNSNELSSLASINNDRAKVGAVALKEDQYLNALAKKRAQHMLDTRTISHVIPDMGSPWTSLKNYNISYKSASENLQYGARSVFEAHMHLMNSHSHKANILRKDFTHVGIAVLPNGKGGYLQVQLFANR